MSSTTPLPTHPVRRALLVAGAVSLALGACSDDGDDDVAVANAAPIVDGVLDVTMDDFHYGDLPGSVPVGTRISVTNRSESELHEFVAFRLAEEEERPAEEIVAGDLGALLGGSEPATVLLAPPGGDEIAVIGDGTLDEPGRYLIVCVIPTGADPGEYLEAAATSNGPPQVDGGAPHVANGMFAELTVAG